MIRAFVFVTLRSLKNRLIHRLRMLKQPRYLVGGILAMLWFSQFFLRGAHTRRPLHFQQWPAMMVDGLAIPVLLVLLLAWLVPNQSLAFAPGEAQFLFSAPLSRRDLLLYKIIRSQVRVIFTVSVMTIFRFPPGAAVGVWACFTTMGIYMMFVELARTRLRELGVRTAWQVGAIVLILALIVTAFALFSHRPDHEATPFDAPILRAILFLPGLFAHAVMARTPFEMVTYAATMLGLGALLFFIASSLRVPFEEIALDASERLLRRRERRKDSRDGSWVAARRMPAPFRLKEDASPEVAIFWKNMVGVVRMSFPFIVICLSAFVVLFALGVFALRDDVALMVCGALSLFMVLMMFFGGGAAFPQDLRHDVQRFDVLKSWPIAGERLVAASIAAPLLVISSMLLLFLTNAALILSRVKELDARVPVAPELVVIAFLFAVPVCAVQLLLRNAAPVFFPAWAIRSKEEQRGFVALGQRLLALLLNLTVFVAVILPAAVVSGVGFWIGLQFAGDQPALLAAMTAPGVALLLLEVWLGIRLLGAQFDRLDVANEMDAAAAG